MTLLIHKNADSTKSRNTGFTLVEVMIAMVIFMVAALALTRLSVNTWQGETVAHNSTEASVRGARFIESISSRAYNGSDLDDGNYTFLQDGYTVNYTISEGALLPGAKYIQMDVSYQMGSATKTMTYNYLLPERK